jgi:hypothetical protein
MTQNKDLKATVRARMAKTGESYTTARRNVLRQRPDATPTTDRATTIVRLQVADDDFVFEGTPRHIVHRMQSLCFGARFISMRDFIAWCVGNVARFGQPETDIKVDGRGSVDAMCRSFLDEMIRVGLAREVGE